jgi:hypothetical protein
LEDGHHGDAAINSALQLKPSKHDTRRLAAGQSLRRIRFERGVRVSIWFTKRSSPEQYLIRKDTKMSIEHPAFDIAGGCGNRRRRPAEHYRPRR